MKKEFNKTKSVFVKKSKMSLAKSTTALTCLVGVLIISAEPGIAASTSGQFTASTSIAKTCTISADTMTFPAYVGATITGTTVVMADCTSGATYTISLADTPSSGSNYLLANTTAGLTSNTLNVTFTNTLGATMTNAAATIGGTGTGASAAAGTITGSIIENQTGKPAGTYSKLMTLNIVY
jgi:hypothetical protein